MDSTLFLQVTLNGLVTGVTYVLIALGLTVVFSIGGIFNFAHGELIMLGGFFFYFVFEQLGIPFIFALILSSAGIALVSILLERIFIHRLRNNFHAVMIMMMGIILIISGSSVLIFGEQDKVVHSPFSGVTQISGIYISNEKLITVSIVIFLIITLYVFLHRFRIGRALRAVGQDREASAIMGIDTAIYSTLSFGLAGFLAGAAGSLMGVLFLVSPFTGTFSLVKGVVIIILGGLGSLPGAVLGGLLLGVLESFTFTFLGTWAEIVTFGILIFVILFRPQGLLGYE